MSETGCQMADKHLSTKHENERLFIVLTISFAYDNIQLPDMAITVNRTHLHAFGFMSTI